LRAAGWSNGGIRWFGRMIDWVPMRSITLTVMSALACRIGRKSVGGISIMSTSPVTSACTAVLLSGM
jgi:hypothetical protein